MNDSKNRENEAPEVRLMGEPIPPDRNKINEEEHSCRLMGSMVVPAPVRESFFKKLIGKLFKGK